MKSRGRWLADGRPIVIAHRGHSTGAPEQTLAAFSAAAALGADMIEADVRRSRDGRLVMLHDATLDRTTNGHGVVADFTFRELRGLDAGGWFSPAFSGELIPSLDELFDLAGDRGVALCLEVKGETPAERSLVAHLVAEQVVRRKRLDRDVVASFDHAALMAAAAAAPGLTIAPERLPERGPSCASLVIEQARRVGAAIVQHHHGDLTVETVEAAHEAGIAVWAWPPTALLDVQRVRAMGVDGLMGDDVAVLIAVAGKRQDVVGDPASMPAPPAAEV
jgi:glycerophosphoryl diester phosphodiesterase